MHQTSMEAMQSFVDTHLAAHRGRPLRVLDVGAKNVSGRGSYRQLIDDPQWHYTGMDVETGDGVDLVLPSPYDWSRLGAETYDVVISGQAFEHIEFPWVTMTEVARVLKRGGLVCVIAPSAGPLHRCPVDCWRYYPDGVSALARWANLDVISAETNWNPQGEFVDYSAWWKDTVLVARRPSARGRRRVRSSIRLRALRTTTTSQATRRQSITSAAK